MATKPKRIAVLDRDLCKPVTCEYLCQRVCPVNRAKKDCITILETDKKPLIEESMCIGCNICAKKCPRQAIEIVNLPAEAGRPTHRYGKNTFALYGLPVPKMNAVVGLIGWNGIGKTTILNILSGNIIPNLGGIEKQVEWDEIIKEFKGSEIQAYLEKLSQTSRAAHETSSCIGKADKVQHTLSIETHNLLKLATIPMLGVETPNLLKPENNTNAQHRNTNSTGVVGENANNTKTEYPRLNTENPGQTSIKVAYKPQHVDAIPKKFSGRAGDFLRKSDEKGGLERYLKVFSAENMMEKNIESLSGGELQLLAIIATLSRKADFYFFDEPSSYLDICQRLNAAREIRNLAKSSVVMVVEHDLAIADYLADYAHVLYGQAGVFGVVSSIYGVRNGINAYLEGYLKEENMRFRTEQILFSRRARQSEKRTVLLKFSAFEKKFPGFSLKTEPGQLHKGEVVGILGPNGIGKTTFIRMLAGEVKPDSGEPAGFRLSYKPQRLVLEKASESKMVSEFLGRIADSNKRILRNLGIEKLLEHRMGQLSGGELQAVFIAKALSSDHQMLLLDEPSAFLDVEQRLAVAKLIREHVDGKEIPAFVVDHDLQFLDSIADRIMVFEGVGGLKGNGKALCSLQDGMNCFLKSLCITFRRDPQTGRARANKQDSQMDREQKESGEYFYT